MRGQCWSPAGTVEEGSKTDHGLFRALLTFVVGVHLKKCKWAVFSL